MVQLNLSWPLMVRLNVADIVSGGAELSLTVTVTLEVPLAVGVPVMAPVLALIDKPAGNPVALQV